MTLVDLLRLARVNWRFLTVLTVLGGVLAAAYAMRIPDVYAADASGYVVIKAQSQSVGDAYAGSSLAGNKAQSYLPLVTSRAVAAEAIKTMGTDEEPADVASRVSAAIPEGSTILKVSALGATPRGARDLADAILKATAVEANRIELGGTVAKGQESVVRVIPVESALLPTAPIAPNRRTYLAAGLAGGLGLGLVLVFLRRQLDTRIRTVKDAEDSVGANVLGVVPKVPELAKDRGRGRVGQLGAAAEAFRHLRTNLRFVGVDDPPRSIVVTSAGAGEGKSTVSSTLARVLGEAGQPVLVIDADLRRPTLAKVFDLPGGVGLSQVLAGDVPVDEAIQETDTPNVRFVAAGRIPPNPSELLGSQRMRALIEELSRDQLVLLDAPPLLPVTDAGLLSGFADGTLFVFGVGHTHREQASLVAKTMSHIGGRILGVVLNKAPSKLGEVLYGYGYGYGSYASDRYTREKYVGKRGRTPDGTDAPAPSRGFRKGPGRGWPGRRDRQSA